MKSGIRERIATENTIPSAVTRTRPTASESVETWTTEGSGEARQFDRLYLRDATLTGDNRGIIASTIAGIEGSGGPISMSWTFTSPTP